MAATGLIANQGIELLTYDTPNGHKIAILLEELKEAYGKDYTYQSINIFKDENKQPWFAKINPNARIPVIVDHDKDGYAVMEGTAILRYLTHFYDPEHKFSFEDSLDAWTAEQWMEWGHGGVGPTQAQANFYYKFHTERIGFTTQRLIGEVERLYGILDARLVDRDYIGGPGRGRYSIADISIWPFANALGIASIDMEEKFPNVYKWWERINRRTAVQKGTSVPSRKPFPAGYEAMQKMAKEDPEGTEERERPFKEALTNAQKEYNYEYKSP